MKVCRLCLEEKKLIKAHIIPQFMYKGMKEAEKVFYQSVYDLDNNDQKIRKLQTGPFDKEILCEDCDNKILGGIYESYAEKSMYGQNLSPKIAPDCRHIKDPKYGVEYTICKNIDYQKFKIFLLSILWRASLSKHLAFKEVRLGEKHEERIRRIILNGEMPDELEYPIMILSYLRSDNKLENLIAQPKRVKSQDKLNAYVFLMNGLQFVFYVNSIQHRIPKYISETTLKIKGEMSIIHLPNGSAEQFMRMVLRK